MRSSARAPVYGGATSESDGSEARILRKRLPGRQSLLHHTSHAPQRNGRIRTSTAEHSTLISAAHLSTQPLRNFASPILRREVPKVFLDTTQISCKLLPPSRTRSREATTQPSQTRAAHPHTSSRHNSSMRPRSATTPTIVLSLTHEPRAPCSALPLPMPQTHRCAATILSLDPPTFQHTNLTRPQSPSPHA